VARSTSPRSTRCVGTPTPSVGASASRFRLATRRTWLP